MIGETIGASKSPNGMGQLWQIEEQETWQAKHRQRWKPFLSSFKYAQTQHKLAEIELRGAIGLLVI